MTATDSKIQSKQAEPTTLRPPNEQPGIRQRPPTAIAWLQAGVGNAALVAAASNESLGPSSRLLPVQSTYGNAAVHRSLQLQRTSGNKAASSPFSTGASLQRLPTHRGISLQPKLTVGAANDQYEQEADRVTQQVMSMPTPPSVVTGQTSVKGHIPEHDEMAQTKPLAATITPLVQRAPSDSTGSFQPGADFESRLSSSGGGSSLPASTRAFMEPRFGADFSGVRLHTGSEAAQLNRAISAQAFTHGRDIYLGEGKNDLESSAGKQLLAHELTHTIQQGTSVPTIMHSSDSVAIDGSASSPVTFHCEEPAGVLVQRQPAPGGAPKATKDPVPGLGPARTELVENDIQAGDFQGALDSLVHFKYMDYEIDLTLLQNQKMTYDPALTSSDGSSSMPFWDYIANKAEPTRVRIGPGAFSSVSYLYSVVMHEYQHVLWRQSLANQKREQQARAQGGKSTSEVEAYAWELLHATESGLQRLPDKTAEIWEHLNEEFWLLDPADQASMRPLAQRALQQAQRIVKGTKETLAPFKPPSSVNP
jgi:hypothetical protein